jgi:hypothetical protein
MGLWTRHTTEITRNYVDDVEWLVCNSGKCRFFARGDEKREKVFPENPQHTWTSGLHEDIERELFG